MNLISVWFDLYEISFIILSSFKLEILAVFFRYRIKKFNNNSVPPKRALISDNFDCFLDGVII